MPVFDILLCILFPVCPSDERAIPSKSYKVSLQLGTLCFFITLAIVSETGRKLGVRLEEHRTQVKSNSKGVFTRSQRTASLTQYNKSALTDHAIQENHTIHWKEASVIDREPDRPTRWIRKLYISARKATDLWIVMSWQLSTESCLRQFSWCDSWSSHQDLEELSTSFFWWDRNVKVVKNLVVIYEFLYTLYRPRLLANSLDSGGRPKGWIRSQTNVVPNNGLNQFRCCSALPSCMSSSQRSWEPDETQYSSYLRRHFIMILRIRLYFLPTRDSNRPRL